MNSEIRSGQRSGDTLRIDGDALDFLVERVVAEVRKRLSFQVEASGRHVHLSREHVDALFGKGHSLTDSRGLSQPGEFLCAERVTLVGPKGAIENAAILGPERKQSQVELSITDAALLGVNAPVRDSGDLEGSATLRLRTPKGEISLEKGVIVARRHIHMTPQDAELFGVADGDRVSVRVAGSRPAILEGVLVRVSPKYSLAMHIDYDEANACGYSKGVCGTIVSHARGQEGICGKIVGESMDQEQLIEIVTKELIRRLGPATDAPQEKPLLVAGEPGCCGALEGACVEYCSSGAEVPDWSRYSGAAIPSLSENQLVLASFGLKCGAESSMMVDALLAGVPVYVIEEGAAWRRAACPDSPLGKHYEACEAKLRSFGVRFVPAAKLAECAAEDVKQPDPAARSEVPAEMPCADLRSKKVLSERDLQELCANGCGEVLVAAKAIITPLGLDWLRLKGISVRRERAK
jgi:propanediol utilization protein